MSLYAAQFFLIEEASALYLPFTNSTSTGHYSPPEQQIFQTPKGVWKEKDLKIPAE